MKANGQFHTIIIPAGSSVGPMQWAGTGFRVFDSTGPFSVKFDGSQWLPAAVGLPYDAPAGDSFALLTFKNDSLFDVTAIIYAGTVFTRDERKVLGGSVGATILATSIAPLQFAKTSTAAAVPVALTAVPKAFQKATVLGKKSLDGTDNAGDVRIGASATANQQPYQLGPGDEVILEAPFGRSWDLAQWFLDVDTDGDGVVVIYS